MYMPIAVSVSSLVDSVKSQLSDDTPQIWLLYNRVATGHLLGDQM